MCVFVCARALSWAIMGAHLCWWTPALLCLVQGWAFATTGSIEGVQFIHHKNLTSLYVSFPAVHAPLNVTHPTPPHPPHQPWLLCGVSQEQPPPPLWSHPCPHHAPTGGAQV